MSFTFALITVATIYFFTRRNNYRWIYIIYKTFKRDLRAAIKFAKLNFKLWRYEKTNTTIVKLFTQIVKKHPNKIAFYFENEIWTFQNLEEFSNKIAHFFKKEGFQRGDNVGLIMESRPEYVGVWLGLSKIGVVTALINNNLVSEPLVHSMKVANVKAVVFGSNFAKSVKDVLPKFSDLKLYELGDNLESQTSLGLNLRYNLENLPVTSPKADLDLGRPRDKVIFIYTSGTTGLPKAAVISNMRFLFMAVALNYMGGFRKDDILYDPLPLYHSAGGMVGIGQCLTSGVTVVIRKKFSASNFWSDCAKYNCTVAQYIGEICRYILAVHANTPKLIDHKIRTIVGNGLRPQIWKEFVDKFGIKEVYEFYGATEGNSNLINIDNKVGAVGFVPRYARKLYPVTLVRCDQSTGEPIRNSKGFCERCRPGEPGVFIGIINPKKTVNDFAGYADKKSTEKKVIENVFKKGDTYFNSGDILVQDEFGYYYFKDRTGDTFRWKGENVATNEVEAVISNLVDFKDAVVFGVEIPHTEGRAGMVAVVDTDNTLDKEKLAKGLKENLPNYAIPMFMRVMESVPLTGTFKLKKTDLQEDGFNLDKVKDKLYYFDSKKSIFIDMTRDLYNDIMSGKVRL